MWYSLVHSYPIVRGEVFGEQVGMLMKSGGVKLCCLEGLGCGSGVYLGEGGRMASVWPGWPSLLIGGGESCREESLSE